MKIWWTALFQGSMYCALFEFCQFYIINHFLSSLSKRYTVAISFTIPILVLYVVQFQSWPFMLWNFSPGPFYVAEYNSEQSSQAQSTSKHCKLYQQRFGEEQIWFNYYSLWHTEFPTVRIVNFCLNCIWLPICHVLAKTGKNVF